jgi:hypothetical protein
MEFVLIRHMSVKKLLGDLSEACSVGSMYECPEIDLPRNYWGEA